MPTPTPMLIQVFDPKTQEWNDFITLDDKYAVSDHASVLHGRKIIFFGGWDAFYTPVATTFSIDPSDNGKIEDLEPMIKSRGDIAAVHYDHGGVNEAFVIGGFHEYCQPLNTIERYDFKKNYWMEISTEKLIQGRGGKVATVFDKKIYIMGGEDKREDLCSDNASVESQAIDNVEVFDPLAKSPSWVLHSLIPDSEDDRRMLWI